MLTKGPVNFTKNHVTLYMTWSSKVGIYTLLFELSINIEASPLPLLGIGLEFFKGNPMHAMGSS